MCELNPSCSVYTIVVTKPRGVLEMTIEGELMRRLADDETLRLGFTASTSFIPTFSLFTFCLNFFMVGSNVL